MRSVIIESISIKLETPSATRVSLYLQTPSLTNSFTTFMLQLKDIILFPMLLVPFNQITECW